MNIALRKLLIGLIIMGIAFAAVYNNLAYLVDWSSAELVGYNTFTLLVLGGAAYLTYRLISRMKRNDN